MWSIGCPVENQSNHSLIWNQLSIQCCSEDGYCYVTSNAHFLSHSLGNFCSYPDNNERSF